MVDKCRMNSVLGRFCFAASGAVLWVCLEAWEASWIKRRARLTV